MKLVQELQEAGYALTIERGKVVCRWLKTEAPDPARIVPLIDELRRRKELVQEYLRGLPGNCETCPAAGFWDGYATWGLYAARYCFHSTFYLGKTAKPRKCTEARLNCPKL